VEQLTAWRRTDQLPKRLIDRQSVLPPGLGLHAFELRELVIDLLFAQALQVLQPERQVHLRENDPPESLIGVGPEVLELDIGQEALSNEAILIDFLHSTTRIRFRQQDIPRYLPGSAPLREFVKHRDDGRLLSIDRTLR